MNNILLILKKVISKYKSDGLINLILIVLKYPFEQFKWFIVLNNDTDGIFKSIYDQNLWSSPESRSGRGSEKHYTKNLRSWLIENIPKYKIRNIVDSPCGDFNWMRYVLPYVSIDYLGLDIVEELIKNNNEKYSSENIRFKKRNIIEESIPNCDLLIVRDCLFHFSYQDINKFLENIKNTNYKYLLTSSHILGPDFKNKDIKTGDYREIDLFRSPFNLRRDNVLEFINDYPEGYKIPRNMILIKKEFVPKSISYLNTKNN